MTTCLLCPSPVVADGLCVPCGAKKWAAGARSSYPEAARAALIEHDLGHCKMPDARASALRELRTFADADAFLGQLHAARKARAAAPLCQRGCTSHEEER
jgi:hypothetical protein